MAFMRGRARITVIRVIDGDTVLAQVECPCCHIVSTQRVRLLGIDAPELDGADRGAAIAAQQYLAGLIVGNTVTVMIARAHPDLYGRMIGDLLINGVSASQLMLQAGMACKYEDRQRRNGPFRGQPAPELPINDAVT